jgi:hypothetical protein
MSFTMIRSALAACLAAWLALSTAHAAPVGGRLADCRTVGAFSRDAIGPVTFRGGDAARVAVAGRGVTDLDLYVYDGDRRLVASDVGSTDRCAAAWTPERTGDYTVVVANYGATANTYTIEMN